MTQGRLQQTVAQYRAQLLTNEAHAAQQLEHAYQHTLTVVNANLDVLYRAMQAKIQAGQEIPVEWLYENNRLHVLQKSITQQFDHYAALAQTIAGQMQHTGVQLGTKSAQAMLQSTVPAGVSYSFGVPSPKAIADLVGVTQDGSPLADLFNGFGQEAAQGASQALLTGVSLGYGPREIAESIQQALGVSRNRALVIARQEALRCYKSAALENYRANSDVVGQWRWQADKGPRTCAVCISLDGSLHDLDEDFESHVCCRCAPVPVTKSWDDILGPLGIDTSDIPETSASQDDYQSGSDWFDEQDAETQKSILGKAGYAAYQDGAVTLDDFVGVSHDEDWGTSRYQKSLKAILGSDADQYYSSN